MSYRLNALGLKLPTLAGCSAPASPQSLQAAMPGCIWSPHQYFVWVPPRAANSHSASLGSRDGFFVAPASHATYFLASLQLTLVTGASSLPLAVKPHALASAHAFHSRTVTGYFPMANGLTVTRWIGRSEASSLLPIEKLPPCNATISGSRTDVDGGGAVGAAAVFAAGEGWGAGCCAAGAGGGTGAASFTPGVGAGAGAACFTTGGGSAGFGATG